MIHIIAKRRQNRADQDHDDEQDVPPRTFILFDRFADTAMNALAEI
jgi:hypothetical protein